MRLSHVLASSALALITIGATASCGSSSPEPTDDPVFGIAAPDPALTMTRTPTKVFGSLTDEAVDIKFSSEMQGKDVSVRVELNGMILTALYGAKGTLELNGVSAADGSKTLVTEADRAAVKRLLAALGTALHPSAEVETKEQYEALRTMTMAEQKLFNVLDRQWSKWPTSMPLEYKVSEEQARSWRSNRRHASSGKTVMGCHDCGDCSWSNLDQTKCCDTWQLGGLSDAAFGNCGTSSWDTQFTWDCTNHDQCVRTSKHGGHWLISLYCDDQFTSSIDDDTFAPSCDYDWRQNKSGSSWTYRADCPTSWKGTNDGCDCFCQFMDPDCDRVSGVSASYNWYGTSNENNCPASWNSTKDGCDFGCQFMDYDCY